MDPKTVLFRTPVGSRLYGNSHDRSDYDYYHVIKGRPRSANPAAPKPVARQSKTGDQDITTVPFAVFVEHANKGFPLALEAMFSPYANEDMLTGYRNGFHAPLAEMRKTYGGVIYQLSRSENYKHRFHALRLTSNLNEAHLRGGRFNPVLDEEEKTTFGILAAGETGRYLNYLQAMSVIDLSID